ncbi:MULTISPECIES: hypothetical protein [unclassified Thioalkalivibrio]|uniref:hypothetical protein n=1 Tax=unclassified Thioalkalivibrio TaxID=2621013 RepID=UPI00036CA782|nr:MULTISPECIES: hypothetical protein [unclassified Thioalkalivibrio]
MPPPKIEAERSRLEVALALGISVTAVAEIERQALRKLARKLRQQGKADALREHLRSVESGPADG